MNTKHTFTIDGFSTRARRLAPRPRLSRVHHRRSEKPLAAWSAIVTLAAVGTAALVVASLFSGGIESLVMTIVETWR